MGFQSVKFLKYLCLLSLSTLAVSHLCISGRSLTFFLPLSIFVVSAMQVDVKRSMEEGENRFNQLSIEERGKFDEETLVNVNNIKRKSSMSQRANGFSNEYIVVSMTLYSLSLLIFVGIFGAKLWKTGRPALTYVAFLSSILEGFF